MFFLSTALAARPPGLDVDASLATWEERAKQLLAGPAGCWNLTGTVELNASGYVPATRWTRPDRNDHHLSGPFTARIEDGTWTTFDYVLTPSEGTDETLEIPVWPLLGRAAAEGAGKTEAEVIEGESISLSFGSGGTSVSSQGGEAANTMHRVLEAVDPSTATAYAQWDDKVDGVALYQDFPLSDGARSDVITMKTVIPQGGPAATALDVTFPGRVKVGDGPVRATIFDAQGHVRTQLVTGPDGRQTAIPTLESLSFGLGALGFTVGYEQRIRYQAATPCAGASPGTAPPPAPPAP
jgi:hypothetical protein